ncbi:hypothetical protein RYX36_037256 [Vicia faba]
MDPCSFLRILIGSIAIKSTSSSSSSKPSFSGKVHPLSTCPYYYCQIKLKGADSPPCHIITVPLISNSDTHPLHSLAVIFDYPKSQILNLKNPFIQVSVYKAPTNPSCIFKTKLLGKISVPLNLTLVESRSRLFHDGWVALTCNKNNKTHNAQLFHLTVQAEPDQRFVFRFDGEPECSPHVYQVKGEVKQPVFTCKFKFSFRDKNPVKGRKGWSIIIHDLSGSPVGRASMVTPFVPSPGSNRVKKSNPGAWLILRLGRDGIWKPWGRLEAWREPGNSKAVGYRFNVARATGNPVTLVQSTISSQYGGKFTIDTSRLNTPEGNSENKSWCGGFVMSARFDGEKKCSKPEVEVGVKHVTCVEDVAAFVALAAAMDLSMDACKLFSQKLRKELRQ